VVSTARKGITHGPTGCTFTTHPGQPMSGNMRMGQLGNKLPSGEDYRPEDVKAMMRQLWESIALLTSEPPNTSRAR
jgi:hypothetical protein